jgi:hypothetical protein
MKVVILQSNYIPWKGYFELINNADVFCFYDEVQYTKNDWRNRNKIMNANGSFWLTIPIDQKSTKLKISEVEFINSVWQEKHFKTIEQCYAKAPYKNEILDLLYPLYIQNKWRFLSQFNQTLIKTIFNYINGKTIIVNSFDYNLKEGKITRLIDLITQLNGSTYISGPAAKDYLTGSENLFEQNKIKLEYKKYGPYIPYKNIHQRFEHNISILDLLMNVPQHELINHITSQN